MKDVKLSAKSQITLPRDVREALGVGPGDQVRFFVVGDQVRLVKPVDVMSLSGMLRPYLKPGQKPVSVEDMNEAIAKAACDGEGLE